MEGEDETPSHARAALVSLADRLAQIAAELAAVGERIDAAKKSQRFAALTSVSDALRIIGEECHEQSEAFASVAREEAGR